MVTMKKRFNSIAIFSSLDSNKILKISQQIEEILDSLQIRKIYPKTSKINFESNKRLYADSYVIKNADLVIAIGGDGTLLSAARKFGLMGVPVLGINLGTIGFLNDIAPEDLTTRLTDIVFGKYIEDERFFLEATINDNKYSNIALNEIVIHSESIAQLIEYELYLNNDFVYRQRADGILIGTPTGSTAYSLSGNGPIIHPDVKTISLLPMFPHSLNTRPLIVEENTHIEIRICKKGKPGLSFDSHNTVRLKQADRVEIKKTKSNLILIHPEDHNFYNACRTKLGWSLGVPSKKLK
tara:strand:- start:5046 stop:5933 length:888 start_codon:yes stop_codon:yes gene_type:complete